MLSCLSLVPLQDTLQVLVEGLSHFPDSLALTPSQVIIGSTAGFTALPPITRPYLTKGAAVCNLYWLSLAIHLVDQGVGVRGSEDQPRINHRAVAWNI